MINVAITFVCFLTSDTLVNIPVFHQGILDGLSCLFVLILSLLILGIASIGLAAAYYSAGNEWPIFFFEELFIA